MADTFLRGLFALFLLLMAWFGTPTESYWPPLSAPASKGYDIDDRSPPLPATEQDSVVRPHLLGKPTDISTNCDPADFASIDAQALRAER